MRLSQGESNCLSTSPLSEIPLLSFFTGAGFLDIGFLQAGFKIIWRNEYNLTFVKGVEYAMAHMPLFNSDNRIHSTVSVTELKARQVAREAFHNLPKPGLFGVIGGPPCPDFSNGGKHLGYEGDHGKLSQVYIDLIIELKPTFFLFENVPGLLHTEKNRQFFWELLHKLAKDYLVDFNVLNALEYGVPQDRERLFLLGFLKRWVVRNGNIPLLVRSKDWEISPLLVKRQHGRTLVPERHWFPWPQHLYEGAKTRYNWPSRSPFGEDIEKPQGIPDELMVGSYICDVEEIARLPNGCDGFQPRSSKFSIIHEGDVSKKSFKRLHRWRYSPAAAYGHNEVHLHPTEPRRLTVREALRIQTVSDAYIFPQSMSLSSKFKMIGNGVPVKLAQAIAGSFAKFLLCGQVPPI
jgi:DNA (cytosine-5)-methyltransferase 1